MKTNRKRIADLNDVITCKICSGYFIDATTIVECLHTFCRSCIVKYLERNKYCPVCEVQVHKTKPLLSIKRDKTIQDVVYKIVPRLFHDEMQRRKDFYDKHPESKPSQLEQTVESNYQHILSPEECVSLTLTHYGCEATMRYYRCPAAVTVGHLQHLIRGKYELDTTHKVEVLYKQDQLSPGLTLMDVAYIYTWKKKSPIDLIYRIYECAPKKPKLENTDMKETNQNNNTWREVQLRISENGEMSITGIHDDLLKMVEEKVVSTDSETVITTIPRTELPVTVTTSVACLSSGTTTTVFSTINKTKCSVKSDSDVTKPDDKPAPETTITNNNNHVDRKRKSEGVIQEDEPKPKLVKETQAADEPVKKVEEKVEQPVNNVPVSNNNTVTSTESQAPKPKPEPEKPEPVKSEPEPVKPEAPPPKQEAPATKPSVPVSRPGTPIVTVAKSVSQPCYMPKPPGNPASPVKINKTEPKVVAKTTSATKPTAQAPTQAMPMTPPKIVKSKPSTPIGYKTLRDPPKSWNSQISKANNLSTNKPPATSAADTKTSGDPKNAKPAKFFKIRNNTPRYLGNPASGVKPMYKVHVSPEQDKTDKTSTTSSGGNEIKRHSIVKIDPKTLKPVSQKAPEESNLSNNSTASVPTTPVTTLSDLKISTSSVPIFRPLLNHSSTVSASPKSNNGSNSPGGGNKQTTKSTSSPTKSTTSQSSSSTTPKRDGPPKQQQPNLSFTPPNPFVPNLASPTLSPSHHQFLFGPPHHHPGLSHYDPRMLAAYQSFWYSQRMSQYARLGLDINQASGAEQNKATPTTQASKPSQPQQTTVKKPTSTKEPSQKADKSLHNTVEKLVQNRTKEILKASPQNQEEKPKTGQDKAKEVDVKDGGEQPKTDGK
ncbi:polycomb group protein Psc [Aethina tumida]|uniref:polycomb group protein Psc n=1 Tax=Aethina tumida TaxID=116153 RepID=UPI0021481F0B|nr:polycomb group protein Psc [Aethina tumida]